MELKSNKLLLLCKKIFQVQTLLCSNPDGVLSLSPSDSFITSTKEGKFRIFRQTIFLNLKAGYLFILKNCLKVHVKFKGLTKMFGEIR